MNEAWITIFGTNAVAVSAGELRVNPGLGRHQLIVPIEVRPTHESAYDHDLSFSGTVQAVGLGGGSGYLGRFHETPPRRLSANSKLDVQMSLDIDPDQIAAIERRRNGAFTLMLQIDVKVVGGTDWGSTQINDHPVSQETWIRILDQVHYQRTILLELPAPDGQTAPHLSKAVAYFSNAQMRLLEGENRLAVEALRQSLAAIVGKEATADEDTEETMNSALRVSRSGRGKYPDRFEVIRQALKFLADLGAHPESDETGPTEARSAIIMVGGLLQWFAHHRDLSR